MARDVAALIFLVLTIGEVVTGATLPTEDDARINVRRQSSCPGSAQMRLAKCAEGMISFAQAKTVAEKVKYCGNARKAQDCMEAVLGECEIVEGTPMEQMVHVVKQSREGVDSLCNSPGKPSAKKTDNLVLEKSQSKPCKRRDKRKMIKCVRRLQQLAMNSRPKCRKVTKTLDCLRGTIAQCNAHLEQEIQENVRLIGQKMRRLCENREGNRTPEVAETSPVILTPEPPVADQTPQCLDVSKSMETCVGPLANLQSSPRANDLEYACGISNEAFDCIDRVISRCGETEEVKSVSAVVNLDQMRSMIRDMCSGNFSVPPPQGGSDTGRCPDDFAIQLQGCSETTKGINPNDKAQACRMSSEAMSCLTKLVADCQHRPEMQMMTNMVNLDQLQAMLDKECKDHLTPKPTVAAETSECPYDVSQSMEKCVDPITKLQSSPRANDLAYVCGISNEAFDCIDGVISRCGETHEVKAMSAVVNIDQMRSMVRDMCSGNFSVPPPQGGSDTGRCPDDFAIQLQGCSELTKGINPNDKAQACRMTSEAMSCLTKLVADCQHRPEMQMMTNMINLDQLQAMLDKECKDQLTPKPTVAVETPECPYDVSQSMEKCVDPLTKLQSSPRATDLAYVCGISNEAFDCIDGVISRCGETDEVKAMSAVVNIDQMRSMVRDMCSGNFSLPEGGTDTGRCPDDFAVQLQGCSEMTQGINQDDKAQACRVSSEAMSCMTKLVKDCHHRPEMQMVTNMVNLDELQTMLDEECKDHLTPKPTVAVEPSECPDVSQSMEKCVDPITKLQSSPRASDLAYVCGISNEAFDCIDGVISRCGETEEVKAMSAVVNIDQMRSMVRDMCSGNYSLPEPEVGSDIGRCPDDFLIQLQGCSEMVEGVDRNDKAEVCRVTSDAMSCLRTLLDDCQHRPDVEMIRRMVNLDQLQAMVDTECQAINVTPKPTVAVETSVCPQDQFELSDLCMGQLKKVKESPQATDLDTVCRMTNTALDCIEDIISRCADVEGIKELTAAVNMDELRVMIRDTCSGNFSLPEASNVTDAGTCPDDFEQQMGSCAQLMDGVDQTDKAEICRASPMVFSCMEPILAGCQHRPDVMQMNKMINLDKAKAMIKSQCKGFEIEPTEASETGQCPGDVGKSLTACVAPMNKLQGSPRAQDLTYVCGVSEKAFACLDDVMSRCADDDVAQGVANMLDINKMRDMVRDMCSGGLVLTPPTNVVDTGKCPADFPQQIQQCSSPLRGVDPENKAEACRLSKEAISCMEVLLHDCAHNPAVASIRGMVKMDDMKAMLNEECSSEDVMLKDASAMVEECDYDDPGSALESCNNILQSLGTVETNERCPTYKRGFACLRDVITRCKSHSRVISFLAEVDVDATEKSLAFFCE